jgi:putative transposase
LDREWFHSLAEARVLLEQYRHRYNAERPHSSLGYRTPAEIRQDHGPLSPPFTPVDDGELALAVT